MRALAWSTRKAIIAFAAALLMLAALPALSDDAVTLSGEPQRERPPEVRLSAKATTLGEAKAGLQMGSVHVSFISAGLDKDSAGRDSLVLGLRWSHNKPEPANFLYSIVLGARQNGKALSPGLPLEGYNFSAASTAIAGGTEQEIYYFLSPLNLSEDILLEMSEFSVNGSDSQSLQLLLRLK